MKVMEAIQARRAVKVFDPEHVMSDSDETRLLAAARLSPTAFNLQNWRFVVVRDRALRQAMRKAAWDQAQVTDASLLIVLCADLKAWAKQPERYWAHAPASARQLLIPAIGQYYEGNEQAQRDEAMRSCGIAAQTLMLAAQELGYDSCPMDGFDFEAVGRLINLPGDHVIAMMVAIGKRAEAVWPRGGTLPDTEVIFENRFP
jgi:nitroreductase